MNPVTPAGAPEIAWPAIAAVLLLTALVTLVHWWLKGRGLIPSSTNPLTLVATRSLGGKRSVAIVEVDRERFLLGLTDDAVSCLATLPSEAKATGCSEVVTFPVGVAR